jgi:hypothetical protein
VDCAVPTIDYRTRTGRIRRRAGQHPSLDAASVKDFAAWLHAREARRQELAATRQRAKAATSSQPSTPDPSDWVDTAAGAKMMGCSESHVPWLARHGRIEGQLVRRRWWYRSDSIRAYIVERDQWISEVAAARSSAATLAPSNVPFVKGASNNGTSAAPRHPSPSTPSSHSRSSTGRRNTNGDSPAANASVKEPNAASS